VHRWHPLPTFPVYRAFRQAICRPAWWAPYGFAATPTTALDPPQRAASPAVPAHSGPGPHPKGRPRPANRHHAAVLPASAIFRNSARTSGWCCSNQRDTRVFASSFAT
jgi:hypothetical protein